MRDPLLALDLDLAIATRARDAIGVRVNELLAGDTEGGGFFAAVLCLLSE